MSVQCPKLVERFKKIYGKSIYDSEEVRSFKEWYMFIKTISNSVSKVEKPETLLDFNLIPKEVERILSTHNEEQFRLMALKKIEKLINKKNNHEEKEMVSKVIHSFLKLVTEKVGFKDKLFSCRAVQVGSSKEGTRTYIQDEFDFLIIFTEIQKYLNIEKCDLTPLFAFIDVNPDKALGQISKEFIREDNSFNMSAFKQRTDMVLCEAVLDIARIGVFEDFLIIDPNYYEKKEISCLHLIWRGQYYKDMKIKIDLVPSFDFETYTPTYNFTRDS